MASFSLLGAMLSLPWGVPAIAQSSAPPKAFGGPPTSRVPLLYNDQHVYSRPDRLTGGRVLSAIVRGKTILVPLRSMFEQMGGVVTYSTESHLIEVSKPGVDVQVTVGRRSIVVNGETRPLDVPAEIDRGVVVVPVRVMSEALGAYVLWVADRRLVVIRFVPPPLPTPAPSATATIEATPAPTAVPSPVPTPIPTATPGARAQSFIVGDALFDPKVYNEFSPGNTGGTSIAGRVGIDFPIDQVGFLAEATVAVFRYPHNGTPGFDPSEPCGAGGQPNAGDPSCVSVLGPASGSAYVAPFAARDVDADGRIGIGIAHPGIYLVGSYESRYENYGYPRLTGFGAGIEKVSDFHKSVDLYGSVLYYPEISGDYVDIDGGQARLEYRYLKYQAGITVSARAFPLFLDLGFLGNHAFEKLDAPASTTDSALYAGLGLHF